MTTGSPFVNSTFNLEIGVPGNIASNVASSTSASAINTAMSNILNRYSYQTTKGLMKLGTFPSIFAREVQLQMNKTISGARVSTQLSGRTTPKTPITGNCK